MVSSIGLRRRKYSRTIEPATFRASTALLNQHYTTWILQRYCRDPREIHCGPTDNIYALISVFQLILVVKLLIFSRQQNSCEQLWTKPHSGGHRSQLPSSALTDAKRPGLLDDVLSNCQAGI
ncbi:hypothetical protein EYF80_009614 [Liparis tanakae]|uniref:Uncharacterized protein n=1 Tax=Liparis tanakae TaxID=230148 RepID=A0A4Z2ISD4_9TELE|nr:hypothetical protein EYF80_009614 [Liparis tanakae]